ncbi:MAG: T9SS type A sorting domain-containing protein [Saprospiraceae bacterium]|nr:T9SS type A sorting domain-containing protein [Saprospiraceae bacterium]
MKKHILVLLLLTVGLAEGKACSCIQIHFCSYLRDTSVKVAVQARVLHSVVYAPDNFAVYLKVLKIYKQEVPITDTIKVYGNDQDFACYVNVLSFFPVGDTVIGAFSSFQFTEAQLPNPDSLTEHYYEVRPTLCNMLVLNLLHGIVTGPITEGLDAYPLDHFEDGLSTCIFPVVDVPEYENPELHFRIYPNPSRSGKLYISSQSSHDPIEKIRVYAVDGRLNCEYFNLSENQPLPLEISISGTGVHVLEIHSGGKVFYQKAIVL